jgi:hypothetical protein
MPYNVEMSAIFGELLTFSQENGPDVQLKVYGDEFYARYETVEGYTVIYDQELGCFVYAILKDGSFGSSGIALDKSPPGGIQHHLEESGEIRGAKAENRFSRR